MAYKCIENDWSGVIGEIMESLKNIDETVKQVVDELKELTERSANGEG